MQNTPTEKGKSSNCLLQLEPDSLGESTCSIPTHFTSLEECRCHRVYHISSPGINEVNVAASCTIACMIFPSFKLETACLDVIKDL